MAEIENDNIVKTMKLHIKVAKDDVQKLIDVTTVYAAPSIDMSTTPPLKGAELARLLPQ